MQLLWCKSELASDGGWISSRWKERKWKGRRFSLRRQTDANLEIGRAFSSLTEESLSCGFTQVAGRMFRELAVKS